MKKTAISLLSLGYTRQSGALLYNPETQEFLEVPVAATRKLIKDNDVVGLKWNIAKGELVPDDVFCDDIVVRTGVGKYRLYSGKNDNVDNVNFALVKILHTSYRGTLYEVINSKCCRMKLDKEGLIGLLDIVPVYGFNYDKDTDEIIPFDSVIIEDRYETSLDFMQPPLNDDGVSSDNEPTEEKEMVTVEKKNSTKTKRKPATKTSASTKKAGA